MKGLKGKLKEEFEGWLHNSDLFEDEDVEIAMFLCFHKLPISMQFSLLCDFLEGKEYYIGISFYTTVAPLGVYYEADMNEEEWIQTDTKQEAIEKAIEYLNKNYEH